MSHFDVCKTKKEQKRIRQSSCVSREWKKKSRENYLLNIWNILYCFALHLVRSMVQIAGAGLLLMWRFNAVIISLHEVLLLLLLLLLFVALSLVHSLFERIWNCSTFAVCSGFMHLPSSTSSSSKLGRITCDYYKSYYIVLFLLYKIRSSCRHFICSFHSYVVLYIYAVLIVTQSHIYTQTHSYGPKHKHINASQYFFFVVGNSLMLSYMLQWHVLLCYGTHLTKHRTNVYTSHQQTKTMPSNSTKRFRRKNS